MLDIPFQSDTISSSPDLSHYTQPPAFDIHLSSVEEEEGPACIFTKEVLQEDARYISAVEQLLDHVDKALEEAAVYSADYKRFVELCFTAVTFRCFI